MPARCSWRRSPTVSLVKYAHDSRFTFGTGKLGDFAGFTSAIVLAMIALLIGYEAVARLFVPYRSDTARQPPLTSRWRKRQPPDLSALASM